MTLPSPPPPLEVTPLSQTLKDLDLPSESKHFSPQSPPSPWILAQDRKTPCNASFVCAHTGNPQGGVAGRGAPRAAAGTVVLPEDSGQGSDAAAPLATGRRRGVVAPIAKHSSTRKPLAVTERHHPPLLPGGAFRATLTQDGQEG